MKKVLVFIKPVITLVFMSTLRRVSEKGCIINRGWRGTFLKYCSASICFEKCTSGSGIVFEKFCGTVLGIVLY